MKFADLQAVNTEINKAPYVADIVDDWFPDTLTGKDCDSYATAKFDSLVRRYGWLHVDLRLALCYVEPFQVKDEVTGVLRWATMAERYHCVLLAELDGQTWTLDNRHQHPMEYELLPYTWDQLQIAGTRRWEFAVLPGGTAEG